MTFRIPISQYTLQFQFEIDLALRILLHLQIRDSCRGQKITGKAVLDHLMNVSDGERFTSSMGYTDGLEYNIKVIIGGKV